MLSAIQFPSRFGKTQYLSHPSQAARHICLLGSLPNHHAEWYILWKSYEICLAPVYIFINSVLREREKERDCSHTGSVLALCLHEHLKWRLNTTYLYNFFLIIQNSKVVKCVAVDSFIDSIKEVYFFSNWIYFWTC